MNLRVMVFPAVKLSEAVLISRHMHACTSARTVVHCNKKTPCSEPWSSCDTLHSVSSHQRKLEYAQFQTLLEEEGLVLLWHVQVVHHNQGNHRVV